MIELKDKVSLSAGTTVSDPTGATTSANPGAYQDAVSSLIILGYKPVDADKFVRKASSQLPANASVEALVKQALS